MFLSRALNFKKVNLKRDERRTLEKDSFFLKTLFIVRNHVRDQIRLIKYSLLVLDEYHKFLSIVKQFVKTTEQ